MENNRFHSASFRKALSPWLFMLPGIIFTVWLRYYPIIKSFYMSLFSYDAVNPPGHFAGFQNYINLFTAAYYLDAWKNTFIFLILQLFLVFWVPLVQAIFLNELKRFQKTFSTIYLITALIPISVSVILWKWIWNPDFGLANQIVKAFGLPQQMWLSNPALTKFCIIFPGFVGGGVGVLLFLSAINGISEDVLEASQLDGCSGWQRIRHIILPNIRFIIIIQLVLAVISSMQILPICSRRAQRRLHLHGGLYLLYLLYRPGLRKSNGGILYPVSRHCSPDVSSTANGPVRSRIKGGK